MIKKDSNILKLSTDFATDFLNALVQKDLSKLNELIDINSSGVSLDFYLQENADSTYRNPEDIREWRMFTYDFQNGFGLEFEVPFNEEYRPMMAIFNMEEKEDSFEVELEAVRPT